MARLTTDLTEGRRYAGPPDAAVLSGGAPAQDRAWTGASGSPEPVVPGIGIAKE
ncbi:hypothetical protein HNR23_002059 [Nocardiopsis mwathae]|uniref:Uncharacterized protein n=1 Tax=Nocardiopsis mwathae TaxID=1472723 RepID=A0A7W9YH09_9ACTN|nr:hypothetical protein [Nocardiopsis mwathae]